MGLSDANKKLKFDARLAEYNIARGLLTKEEWDQYLKSLPDDKEKAAPLEIGKDDSTDSGAH